MKVKMQLDLAGIKNWLFEHGEKIGFAIVAVVFLLFTYSAFSREVLDASKQPVELQRLADNVRQHVTGSRFDRAREGVQVVNYAERAMSKPVKADDFALSTPFSRPVADPKAKRGDPEVLGPEELRVAGGFDVFGFKPEGGGAAGQQHARLQAQPWAVVTGLVPVARQEQEFKRAFAQAVGADPKRDVPKYYMPNLERTEVDEKQPDKENWSVVKPATEYEPQWASIVREFVAAKYTDPELTGHLCNLFYNEWGESVSHPKIPRAGEQRERASEPAAAPDAPPAEAAKADAKEGGPVFKSQTQVPEPKRPQGERTVQPVAEDVIEYRLLRVFDYSVQPGKKYRYRVTLGLQNPNYGLSPLQLKKPESAANRQLAGQPSAATSVVTIPDGHRVLAGPVDAGSRYTEPSATLVVTAIDPEEGIQAAAKLEKVRRGTVANKKQEQVKVKDPRTQVVKDLTLDFESNILVLDIHGGRTLPGKRRSPAITTFGEVLLLDAEGNMMVRSELDDQSLYSKSLIEDKAEPAPKNRAL